MLEGFAVKVISGVLKDPEVQQFIKDLIGGVIAEKIPPLFPFALGSALKRLGEMIPGVENVKDATEYADEITEDIAPTVPNTGFKPFDDFVDHVIPNIFGCDR